MDNSFFLDLMSNYGYIGIVLGMMLEGIIIIIPSEIILIVAGILVANGIFTMFGAITAGVIGSVLCALVLYSIGYFGGRPFVEKYGKYFFINKKDLAKADSWFLKYGLMAAMLGRNFPIIRTFISIPMGISKINVKKFTFFTTIGSVPWTIIFIFAGFKLGESAEKIVKYVEYLKIPIIIIMFVFITIYIVKHLKQNGKK